MWASKEDGLAEPDMMSTLQGAQQAGNKNHRPFCPAPTMQPFAHATALQPYSSKFFQSQRMAGKHSQIFDFTAF